MPIQRVILSGSTRNAQTVSGAAAIEIVRSTVVASVVASMLRPLFLLRFAFERLEPDAPELLQKLLQLVQPFGPGAVEPPRSVAPFAHEPSLLEHVEVLRDRRP